MKKIITFAGHSQRFLNEGYPIKPLIQMGDVKVFDLIIKTITGDNCNESDLIFILKETDCVNLKLDELLRSKFPQVNIQVIKDHKEGPVITILNISDKIPDDEEIVVSYCDLYINWKFNDFLKFCRESNSDGVVATHTNWHPHRVYNNYFCYLKTKDELVLELQEKKSYTANPIQELASSGVYYFKSGSLLKDYFTELVKNNIRVNNEFYVTMPFNLMIKDSKKVTYYNHDSYFCLGTPKDIKIIQSYITLREELGDKDIIKEVITYFNKYYNIPTKKS